MPESESAEEVLQPLSLDPPRPPKTKGSAGRLTYALLLVVILAGWSVLMVRWTEESVPREQTTQELPPVEVVVETVKEEALPSPLVTAEPEEIIRSTPVLTVQSTPPGASVFQEGSFLGTTPLELTDWREGATLQIRRSGYRLRRVQLPAPEASTEVEVTLEAETASVQLAGELEGAEIQGAGHPVDLDPDSNLMLPLTGAVVRVEKPGFTPWEREVIPARTYVREIRVDLSPRK
jgi:hypothetical protein